MKIRVGNNIFKADCSRRFFAAVRYPVAISRVCAVAISAFLTTILLGLSGISSTAAAQTSIQSPSPSLGELSNIPDVKIEDTLPTMPSKSREKVQLEVRTQVEYDTRQQVDGTHDYVTKSSVGVQYAHSRQAHFSAFLPFRATHRYKAGPTRDGQYHVHDLVLGFSYKFRNMSGFFNELAFMQNLHLPTGEESRSITHNHGAFSNAVVANHRISRTVEFRLNEEGEIFNQTSGWYSYGKKKSPNYAGTISEYGELAWSPTESFSISQYFGYVHTWMMASPTVDSTLFHEAYLETSMSYSIHRRATVTAAYRNMVDTQNAEHDWSPYRPDESTIVSALKLVY